MIGPSLPYRNTRYRNTRIAYKRKKTIQSYEFFRIKKIRNHTKFVKTWHHALPHVFVRSTLNKEEEKKTAAADSAVK